MDDETVANLTAAWDVRGIELDTVQFHGGTAVAETRAAPMKRGERVTTLPSLLAPGPAGAKPQFELGTVLGEGGMGVVRTAKQLALSREVAVKSLKSDVDADSGSPQLLREGRVTGVLEHPNVVPVYALGRDNQDRPLMVMKRIEGTAWSEQLAGVDDRRTDAYLRRHLATLKQVALATHFAHSRGIIHRDLKPENIMIGGFGEVYVVDWGVAVSTSDRDLPDVPKACTVQAIEGTPAYLSPEMAAGDGEAIDERSDVFLLGAILHEIITGEPPHEGRTLRAVLINAFKAEPKKYGSDVPRGLVQICNKAMARHNDDRYASAADLAEAIDEFMVHRSSTQLSDEAASALIELEQLLDQHEDRDAEKIYATFSTCRFAFNQALRSWSENTAASQGLQSTLELMIGYELGRGAPRAALSLLRELPSPNAALADQVEEAAAKGRDAEAKLNALKHEADLNIGQAVRRVVTLLIAALYGAGCILCGVLTRSEVFVVDHLRFSLFNLLLGGTVALFGYLRRESLLINQANRRLTFTAVTVFAGYAALWLAAAQVDMTMMATAAVHCVIGAAMWALGTMNVDRKWAPLPIGSLLGLAGVLYAPIYYFEMIGTSALLSSMVTVARYMGRYDEER